ncbi:MAG: hypothetical protein WD535_01945, partial [Thermaerobacterales bacterium]
ALLARIFVKDHPLGKKYMSAREYTHAGIRQQNRNRLLFRDERVTGLKTGFLSASGYHLVATAEEGDLSLAAAVLGASSVDVREQEALALLNYGFRTYMTFSPTWGEGGEKVLPVFKGRDDEVRVRPQERLTITVARDAAGRVTLEDDLPEHFEAPLEAGAVVGRLSVTVDGETEAVTELVAAESVERGSIFRVIIDSVRLFLQGLFGN